MVRSHRPLIVCIVVVALLASGAASAQIWTGRGLWGGWRGERPRYPTAALRDGQFHFCRLMFESDRGEPGGQGWRTDYPGADINFSIRFSELTKAAISKDPEGDPEYFVVRIDDPSLFACPYVHMEDVGTASLSESEVLQLRNYLLKGGFMWADDFWGPLAWEQWASEIARVLPPDRFPIVDIPVTHSVFQSLFKVKRILQVPAISRWRAMGGATSERGPLSAEVHSRGIFDENGRLMVLMTHNTDISDTWEREGEDVEYFYRFSPEGYAIAINVLLYAMTH